MDHLRLSDFITMSAPFSYDRMATSERNIWHGGETAMASIEQFRDEVRWTAAEKKVARKAFDQALERHLSAITAEAKRMMANVADPTDLWQLEAYLSESRKTVDRIYQFRYSDLLQVFSVLMRDDWLKEADLVGLQPEKIADIKRSAEGLRRMFRE
jgi:Photoprotection regulator fluorescence recovery protein